MDAWTISVETVRAALGAGVREFVVCAGARNAALLEVLARAESQGRVKVWRHFEERSAGFFALGRTLAIDAPCAVVTTSGTAAAELLPAMIEAHYQARPLVAITADRPARFRGTGAPQAIEQPGIFGPHAVSSYEEWTGLGPLHLNVELEEDFKIGEVKFAEPAEFVTREKSPLVGELARWLREDVYRGLVVMIGGLEPSDHEEVFHFCSDLGVPVVVEGTSGLREALQELALPDADRTLKASPPGKILRLGDVPSGRFWRDLEDLPKVEVWSVCRGGFSGLARESKVIRGGVARVLRAIGDVEEIGDALDHLVDRSRRTARIEELLEAHPDSEPAMVRTLSLYASYGSSVYLGNSMPVREWNLFAQWDRPVTEVRANRGANGIDGQASTWLGWTADKSGAWAVLGDLTALYDLAAPFVLDQLETKGRVLAVVNNHGGRIFERLPRLADMSPRAAECFTNPQAADLSGWAKLWGMRHVRITNADDFDALEQGDETVLLEVLPDAAETKAFWADWDRM
ncbi:thiamine pyrophosphate-binding protein [Luteolibacter sp. LG18]|uniref:thiamine pyrophosphate-binding protein n=1 Tax=Luteolibacter sp. LG18 TaxID=2819286 RepID=UPI002B2D9384|nr:2-succinyl-5-enolpyruvyl-6-hydroxy-3-cyclohexene- 1-carboxylate synthase [Luteolibacter sp. LG18]